jgi:hypothetical protein
VALLRLPPVDDVPPPMRGVVTLALRFGFTGPARQGEALLAPMRRVATPVLDSVGPMSFAAVDAIHMDPQEPLPSVVSGGLLRSVPAQSIEALLDVAGPGVDTPVVQVELRLMGGALGRPAQVPNAVAGREGAYALTVVAPAPPPLLAGARVATDDVVSALQPWSTGTSLVNFTGNGDPSTAWTPEVLERLRRVKATADPRNIFGGALTASVSLPVGA